MNTSIFKKLSFATIIVLLLVSGGCKKFLNQTPITELGTDKVFADAAGAYKALAGVYSRLAGDQVYGIRISLYFPLDNDEMQGPTGNPDNDRRDIARYSATSGNAQIERPFNQLFQGIEFANICIDNIPKMSQYASSKQLQRMHGEALTLRAQFYFEAIRNWGDLPAHFQPASVIATANPFPSRVNRDTLYTQLLEDLRIAADLVPWRNEIGGIGDPTDERITKGAVKALRARIALFRAGWSLRATGGMQKGSDPNTYYQIARTECNDIMTSGQHAMNPSFRGLWKDQVCAHAISDPQGELMFQASAFGLTGAEDTKLGYYNGPRVNNLGNSSVNPLPSYFYLFDSTDQRRDVTNALYFTLLNGTKAGQAITNLTDGKYRRDWITNPSFAPTDGVQYFGLKWQIIRFSDVLLMFAEAENELNGPNAAAYDALNKVRRRGYGKPINTPDAVDIAGGLSKGDFFKALVRERALELGGEGIRKYDLIRWNLLATALAESKANMLKMSTNTAMINPTYMAGYPSYCLSTGLPQSMYFNPANTTDNNSIGGIWNHSLYFPVPAPVPAGTRVNWVRAEVNTTAASRYATGFVTGKGELLPIPQAARDANVNMTQNPNY